MASWSISDMVIREPISMPFATLTTNVSPRETFRKWDTTPRRNCDGTAVTIISFPSIAPLKSLVASTASGMRMPGRKEGFRRVWRMSLVY